MRALFLIILIFSLNSCNNRENFIAPNSDSNPDGEDSQEMGSQNENNSHFDKDGQEGQVENEVDAEENAGKPEEEIELPQNEIWSACDFQTKNSEVKTQPIRKNSPTNQRAQTYSLKQNIFLKEGSFLLHLKLNKPLQENGKILLDTPNDGKGFRLALETYKPLHSRPKLKFYVTTDNKGPQLLLGDLTPFLRVKNLLIGGSWNSKEVALYINGIKVASQERQLSQFPLAFPASLKDELYVMHSRRFSQEDDQSTNLLSFKTYDKKLSDTEMRYLASENSPKIFSLKEGDLEFQILDSNHFFGIYKIKDTALSRDVILPGQNFSLWKLQAQEINSDEKFIFEPNSLYLSTLSCEKASSSKVKLHWNFKVGSKLLKVQQFLEIKNSELQSRLSVSNETSFILDRLSYSINGLRPVNSMSDSHLLLPSKNLGSVVDNPFQKTFSPLNPQNIPKYPSGSYAMQWMGLYDSEVRRSGIYWATYDSEKNLKSYEILNNQDEASALDLIWTLYLPHSTEGGNEYTQAWPFVMGLQDGDWSEFALRYKNDFVDNETPKRTSRLFDKNILIHYPSATPSSMQQMIQLKNSLGYEDEPILWHYSRWQEANQYFKPLQTQLNDSPTTSASDDFNGSLQKFSSDDVLIAPYFLVGQWDSEVDFDSSQKNLNRFSLLSSSIKNENLNVDVNEVRWAVKDSSGNYKWQLDSTPHLESTFAGASINSPKYKLIKMCPTASYWQKIISDSLKTILSRKGVAGVYVDEVAYANPRFCYDEDHPHSQGGGDYHVMGYQKMMKDIPLNSNQFKFTEGFSDAFISDFDGFLVGQDLGENSLPFAILIYHDRTRFIGSAVTTSDSIEEAFFKQHQAASWGIMPGYLLIPYEKGKNEEIIRETYRLGHLQNLHEDFMIKGSMLPNPDYQVLDGEEKNFHLSHWENEAGDRALYLSNSNLEESIQVTLQVVIKGKFSQNITLKPKEVRFLEY